MIQKKIKGKDLLYGADYLWGRIKKLWLEVKEKNYSIISGAGVHMIDLVMWLLNSKPNYVFQLEINHKQIIQNLKIVLKL